MSKTSRERDRTIALAGLLQAITLVQQIAETGQIDQADFETVLNSLVATDATTTEAVYGSLNQLKTGLQQLNKQLSKDKSQQNMQILRIVLSLLHLERRLAKQPEMLDLIGREIDQANTKVDYFGTINSPQVIAHFADIYHQTVSELSPRIQVNGDPQYLQQADNVNRVRALLLAGIRATILWRQKGGKRWQFIFQSAKILKTATELQQSL